MSSDFRTNENGELEFEIKDGYGFVHAKVKIKHRPNERLWLIMKKGWN